MKTNSMILALVLLTAAFAVSSQSVYTPDKGSPERKAILNALRLPVQRDLGQKVTFVTNHLNVRGTWAFVGGDPRKADGGEIDYSKTKYAEQVADGVFDGNVFALLRKTSGKWRITKYQIGCTDVCYSDWWKTYRAPKAIFPYTE